MEVVSTEIMKESIIPKDTPIECSECVKENINEVEDEASIEYVEKKEDH